MGLFDKISGKSDKKDSEAAQEAQRQLEATRRETAQRLGSSRTNLGYSGGSLPAQPPPSAPPSAPRAPAGPPPAQPPVPSGQPPAPSGPPPSAPGAPPGGFGSSFGAPTAGSSATPDDERRTITDMALEDLQRQRQSAPDTSIVVTNARVPEEELERRRPPAPAGERLPGVPPPDIPSEHLRDQALQEILERKERLAREYRERQGGQQPAQPQQPAGRSGPSEPPAAPARPKTRLHGLAAKKKLGRPAPGRAKPEQTEERVAPPQPAAEAPVAQAPPAQPRESNGESIEEALAGVKGVGPRIRSALIERFDSVEAIRNAEPDELTEVNGVGPALASRIQATLSR